MMAPLPLFDKQWKRLAPAEKARVEALIEKVEADDILVRAWKTWRHEEVTAALAGPHGADLAGLIAELKAAPSWDAIDTQKLLAPWRDTDRDMYALVVRVINAFVASKREEAGLPPWDDGVPAFGGER
jgi:hypothetical protein